MRFEDRETWGDVLDSHTPRAKGMTINRSMPVIYNTWPSLIDLLDDTFKNKYNEQLWKGYSNGYHNDQSWWGIKGGIPAVENAIRNGWSEGLEKARAALDKVEVPRFQSIKRRKMRGDFGDEIDMQSVYSGNLDRAWTRTRRQMSPSRSPKRITIIVDSALSSSVDARNAFWTGAVALRLNDALQESGRNVQIVSTFTCQYPGEYVNCPTVVLKDYADPLEPEVIAATLSLAGFARSTMFRAAALFEKDINSSWGFPVHMFIPKQFRESSDSVFLISDIWSKEAAEKKIAEMVKEIGGEA